MQRAARRAVFATALTLVLALTVSAGDLTIVRHKSGQYAAYALGEAGFHQAPIELPRVSSVQLGGGMAKLTGGRITLLVGAAESGVVTRRIDQEVGGTVSNFRAGDRLALAKGRNGWFAYGVAGDAIVARRIQGHVSSIRLSGDMAYVRAAGKHLLLAATDGGVVHLDLGASSPRKVDLARNQATTQWSGRRTYLHVPDADGIHTVDLSHGGAPRQVWVGGMPTCGESDS